MLCSPEQVHGHHPHPRCVHGHDDHGDALVLGRLRVGPHGQPAVVGVAGQAGEDLGPVDDELVAVDHGARLQRGQVRAGVRLRVADAEVDLPGQDLGQEELLLLLAAVVHDRRADRVDGEHGHRRPAAHGLVEEDELLDGGTALTAPLRGPADPQPAVGRHLLGDPPRRRADAVALGQLLLDLGGEEIGVVLAQLPAKGLLLLGVADLHGRPLSPPLTARDQRWNRLHFALRSGQTAASAACHQQ